MRLIKPSSLTGRQKIKSMDNPKELFYDYMFRGDYKNAEEQLKKLRGKSKERAEEYLNDKKAK